MAETKQVWKAGDVGTAEWCAARSQPAVEGMAVPDGWSEVKCCICQQLMWWHTSQADVRAYQIGRGYMACQGCISASAEGLIWCVAEAGFIQPPAGAGVNSSSLWCCHHQKCPAEFLAES